MMAKHKGRACSPSPEPRTAPSARQRSPREVATLKAQLQMLQQDLTRRAADEAKLQNVNQQLRARLESYKQQNQQNVRQAESEMMALHQELVASQTSEMQLRARLEESESGMDHSSGQGRVEALEAENRALREDLAALRLDAARLSRRQSDSDEQLEDEWMEQQKEAVADRMCVRKMKKKFLDRFILGVLAMRREGREAHTEAHKGGALLVISDLEDDSLQSLQTGAAEHWKVRQLRAAMHGVLCNARAARCLWVGERHFMLAAMRTAWGNWVVQQSTAAMLARAGVFARERALVTALERWREACSQGLVVEVASRRADRGWRRLRARRLAQGLSEWRSCNNYWARLIQSRVVVRARGDLSRLRHGMRLWMRQTHLGLKSRWVEACEELSKYRDHAEGEKERMAKADMSNLELVNHIHELTAQIATLQASAADHDAEALKSSQLLEDALVMERSLQNEITMLETRVVELQKELKAQRAEAIARDEQVTEQAVQQKMEMNALESANHGLKGTLAEKSDAIVSTEKALAQACASLEQQAAESQQKLQAAFEIAASLRKLLEDKDVQFNHLTNHLAAKDLKISELETQLQSFTTLASARVSREDQISSLRYKLEGSSSTLLQEPTKHEGSMEHREALKTGTQFSTPRTAPEEQLMSMSSFDQVKAQIDAALKQVDQNHQEPEPVVAPNGIYEEMQRLQKKIIDRLEDPNTQTEPPQAVTGTQASNTLFDQLDVNHDGVLDREEFGAYRQAAVSEQLQTKIKQLQQKLNP